MKKIIPLLVLAAFALTAFAQHDGERVVNFDNLKFSVPNERLSHTRENTTLYGWSFWSLGYSKDVNVDWGDDPITQALADGWTCVDNDGDGQTFQRKNIYCLTQAGCNGGGLEFLSSWSYYYYEVFNGNPPVGPAEELDNWLISPPLTIPAEGLCAVEWGEWSFNNLHGDQYKLMISPTGDASPASFTYVAADVTIVDGGSYHLAILNEFAGQTIRVAFWHYAGQDAPYGAAVFADYLEVYKINDPIIYPQTTTVFFSFGRVGESIVKSIPIFGVLSTGEITATSSNPNLYLVSGDGITYAATASLPSTDATLYVKFTPTEIGYFEGDEIVLSSTTATSVEIQLCGEATDCRNIETPYVAFVGWISKDLYQNTIWCWDFFNEDPANPNDAPYISGYDNAFLVFNSNRESVNGNYNQWAISPELHSAAELNGEFLSHLVVAFKYWDYDYSTYHFPEVFAVGYSSTDKELASFTFASPITVETSAMTSYECNVPAGTKYVAIKYLSEWGYRLFVSDFSVTPVYDDISSTNTLISNQVSIYPNPAKDQINLVNAKGDVQIINSLGVVVYKDVATPTIDVSKLAAGTYFVKVAGETHTISIVK